MKYTETQVEILLSALEKIAKTKYVDYSDAEDICREALAEYRQSQGRPITIDTNTALIANENCIDANTVIITTSSELIASKGWDTMKDINSSDSEPTYYGGHLTEEAGKLAKEIDDFCYREFDCNWIALRNSKGSKPKITPEEIEAEALRVGNLHYPNEIAWFKAGANFILEKLGLK